MPAGHRQTALTRGSSKLHIALHTGSISDSQWTSAQVALSGGAGEGPGFVVQQASATAQPSSLSTDGAAFSVAYSSGADPSSGGGATTSTAGGSGYGYGSAWPLGLSRRLGADSVDMRASRDHVVEATPGRLTPGFARCGRSVTHVTHWGISGGAAVPTQALLEAPSN